MTQQQWRAIEATLAGLSADDKLELIDRLRKSIEAEPPASDRTRRQHDALAKLCAELESLPSNPPADGLTNRDHDAILYSQ